MKGITKEIKKRADATTRVACGKKKPPLKLNPTTQLFQGSGGFHFPVRIPGHGWKRLIKWRLDPAPNQTSKYSTMTEFSPLASCLLSYWWHVLFSQEKLYFWISQPRKDARLLLTYLHPQHAVTPDETLLSAGALHLEFYLTGSSRSAFTCAIIHIFHFHHLSIDPTSKNVPVSICGCLAILQPSETNETTKLLFLNLMQDSIC